MAERMALVASRLKPRTFFLKCKLCNPNKPWLLGNWSASASCLVRSHTETANFSAGEDALPLFTNCQLLAFQLKCCPICLSWEKGSGSINISASTEDTTQATFRSYCLLAPATPRVAPNSGSSADQLPDGHNLLCPDAPYSTAGSSAQQPTANYTADL